jgi:hypothetical protein
MLNQHTRDHLDVVLDTVFLLVLTQRYIHGHCVPLGMMQFYRLHYYGIMECLAQHRVVQVDAGPFEDARYEQLPT